MYTISRVMIKFTLKENGYMHSGLLYLKKLLVYFCVSLRLIIGIGDIER